MQSNSNSVDFDLKRETCFGGVDLQKKKLKRLMSSFHHCHCQARWIRDGDNWKRKRKKKMIDDNVMEDVAVAR